MESYEELLPFCRTGRQRQVLSMLTEGGSMGSVQRRLGVAHGTMTDIVSTVRRYAALKGVAKEHDMVHEVPDPFVVKGVSSLYSKGELKAQWVKTTLDGERLQALREAMAREYAEGLPRYVPKKAVVGGRGGYSPMLAVYPIPDAHIGQLAWEPETGNDYDAAIAERTIIRTVKDLLDRSPSCEECLIENLGDLLHVDNMRNMTERSGNVLDVDGRYAKILQVGIRTIRSVIEYSLVRHRRVTMINCCGNHDDLGCLWLGAALRNIYEREKRIRIIDSPAPRHYYRYGNTLIGCTHGQDVKPRDLPVVMAAERSSDWGATDYRYWHTGHLHQDRVTEVAGCRVEVFRAVCGRDAWTNAKGYMSGRDMKALFFDREHGEVERHIVAIR